MESQKVIPETLEVHAKVRSAERANFLRPLVRASFEEADNRRDSLALLQPESFELQAVRKQKAEIESERLKHKELADQLSMFDAPATPLTPCPVSFKVHWRDQEGKRRSHECDDWETSTAYNRFERMYGPEDALIKLNEKYHDYFQAGMVLGFSTHSRRNLEFSDQNQWLLVGMIRLDHVTQATLDF